jgi:hypothetical protein
MPTTGLSKLRYPNASDIPDGPAALLALAQDVARNVEPVADAAARAALVTDGYAYEGMLVRQADTKAWYVYESSAWRLHSIPWASYTPTLTNMVIGTGGSAKGTLEWRNEGDQIHVRGYLILGSSGQSMGSVPTMTLPVPAAAISAPYQWVGTCGSLNDVSAATVATLAMFRFNNGNTTVAVLSNATGTPTNISSTAPFTWAAGDAIYVDFIYDPA